MRYSSRIFKVWAMSQSWIAVVACLGMFAGLFWSRAALSIAIILFFVNALHPHKLKERIRHWKKEKFSIICFLLFVAYLISGLWTDNLILYRDAVLNKLPFAILPFAFLSLPLSKSHFKKILVIGLLLMQVSVIFYSLSQLLLNWGYYIEGYNFSHTLPTTKYNDHIRFSLSLVLSLLIILYFLFEKPERVLHKTLKLFFYCCAFLFIAYLHILAVKTGLLTLYLLISAYTLGKLYKSSKLLSFAVVGFICVIPFLAYYTIPTFKTKINYILYEIRVAKEQDKYDYTLSDQGRLISYKVGLSVLKDHLFLGTGAGDLKSEMNKSYEHTHPEVPLENRLIPHNQFLYTAVALGIFLSLIPIFLLLTSFMQLNPPRLYAQVNTLVFFTAFMVEAMLEIQFGVFIFLFYTLFWRNINRQSTYFVSG